MARLTRFGFCVGFFFVPLWDFSLSCRSSDSKLDDVVQLFDVLPPDDADRHRYLIFLDCPYFFFPLGSQQTYVLRTSSSHADSKLVPSITSPNAIDDDGSQTFEWKPS